MRVNLLLISSPSFLESFNSCRNSSRKNNWSTGLTIWRMISDIEDVQLRHRIANNSWPLFRNDDDCYEFQHNPDSIARRPPLL